MKKYSIAVIGLSSPLIGKKRMDGFKEGLKFLESSGNKVKVFPSALCSIGYKTSTIEARLDDLHTAFSDKNIDLIINLSGGYNSNELLEFIDYELISQNPKPFVGYSDITAINLALYTKANLQTINGCMAVDYAFYKNSYNELFNYLANGVTELNFSEYWINDEPPLKTPKIQAVLNKDLNNTGNIVVANLSTFNLLLGTEFMPDLKGKILFLEYDKEEQCALPSLERMLWQIRQNEIFKKINGLVFGLLEPIVQQEEKAEYDLRLILEQVTKGYNFPVLYNFQFGHVYPSIIIQNGRKVAIENNKILIY
jgi:muramoyltetrapeptide carboxypeptidase